MGEVYQAFEPDLQRRVAIKFVRRHLLENPDRGDETRRRFLQEARAAAALSHPGITAIFRIGEERGQPYFVMEWLEGETLEAHLKRCAPLPFPEVARIGAELAEALDAAHAAGVVHRDVKPSNLVLLPDGRLKVTDFGIAQISGANLVETRAGEVVGTPRYASPEQLLGKDLDGRSDQFSVGVVLYYALTGRHPFNGENQVALSRAVVDTEPPPIVELMPPVPTALAAAVHRALRKDRRARFSRMAEMSSVLRAFASSSPIVSDATLPGLAALDFTERSPAPDARPIDADGVDAPRAIAGVPADARRAVTFAVSRWPARPLGRVVVSDLLGRLVEIPLHAEAFAGAVRFGSGVVALIHGGRILGAVGTGASGDEALEALPSLDEADLLPVPSGQSSTIVPLLASLLLPPRERFANLDSSFVDLPKLGAKLEEERFDGAVTLRSDTSVARILLSAGKAVTALLTGPWADARTSDSWTAWAAGGELSASVESLAVQPLHESFRKLLPDVPLDASGDFHDWMTRSGPGGAIREASIAEAPMRRFYAHLLWEIPEMLAHEGMDESLRYLSSWIPLIRRAVLHHALPRPQAAGTDSFDLVTFDAEGKALHVAHRVARGTGSSVRHFAERVAAAKGARLRSGDIGAALLVAPSFDAGAIDAWRAITDGGSKKAWSLAAIDRLTEYHGFVRLGPRRGYHLILVEEKADSYSARLRD